MTYDWATLEALEEVDAIGWAAPPVAPPKRDPLNTGLAMMQGTMWQVGCSTAEMQYAIRFVNAAGLGDAALLVNHATQASMGDQLRLAELANQAGQASIEAALRLRGMR